jgi:hypothetical protein
MHAPGSASVTSSQIQPWQAPLGPAASRGQGVGPAGGGARRRGASTKRLVAFGSMAGLAVVVALGLGLLATRASGGGAPGDEPASATPPAAPTGEPAPAEPAPLREVASAAPPGEPAPATDADAGAAAPAEQADAGAEAAGTDAGASAALGAPPASAPPAPSSARPFGAPPPGLPPFGRRPTSGSGAAKVRTSLPLPDDPG